MGNNVNKFIIILVIGILLVSLGGYLISRAKPSRKSILTAGKSAEEFCSEICGGLNNLYTSNNNTTYNFVRCECIGNTENVDSYGRAGSVLVYSDVLYFDSYSLANLTEAEILNRIQEQ